MLVVDDEDAVRRFLRIALDREGYAVLTASNGLEAWHELTREGASVDLVISDVVMPELDGLALAARVRDLPDAPPLIFISGFLNDRSRLSAALGRPARFVPKPFDLVEFIALVHSELSDETPREPTEPIA